MPIQFIINGQQYEDPLNWDDFAIRLARDRSLNAVIVSYDISLILGSDAYALLNNLRLENLYCEPLTVKIKYHCGNGNWYDLVRGYIFLTECRFNLTECTVSTRIFDESFSSYIGNNRSVPFNTTADRSKELVPIPSVTIYQLTTFDPKTGIYDRVVRGYKLFDVFDSCVNFISNNKVKLISSFLSNTITGADGEYSLFITSGASLRSTVNTPFTTTFLQLYEAIRSKYNLGIGFQLINGVPHILIERSEYFLQDTTSTTIREVNNVTAYYDQQQLFNRVQFGSQTYTSQFDSVADNNYLSFPDIDFRGFQDETFYVIGECNIDNILDCFNETPIIIDNNTIEDIVIYNNNAYDKVPVLIQCFGDVSPFSARQTDPLGLGQTVYNGDLTNDNTANNFIGAVPNSIYSSYLGYDSADLPIIAEAIADGNFADNCATFSPAQTVLFNLDQPSDAVPETAPFLSERVGIFVPYNTIIADPGANYNITNFSYLVPAPGRFVFRSRISLQRCGTAPSGQVANVRIALTITDLDGNILQRIFSPFQNYFVRWVSGPTSFQLDFTFPELILGAGFIVKVDLQARKNISISDCPILINQNIGVDDFRTDFQTVSVQAVEGGELKEFDPNDYKRNAYNFKQPISFEQVRLLFENPFKQIKFTYGFQQLQTNKGFIDTVIISDFDKFDTEFTLISST
jgi:hypothetical protein